MKKAIEQFTKCLHFKAEPIERSSRRTDGHNNWSQIDARINLCVVALIHPF